MAHWTTTLDGSWFGLTSGSDRWTPPAADRPSIPAALRASAGDPAFLARLLLTDGRIVLHIEDDQSGGLSQGVVNLSSVFTSGGTIQLEAAGASFRVALADQSFRDINEPYSWTWADEDGGSDITALRAALPETGGNTPATLTLWDGQGTNPFTGATDRRLGAGFAGSGTGTLTAALRKTEAPEPGVAALAVPLVHFGAGASPALDGSWRSRAGTQGEGGVPADYLRGSAAGDITVGASGFDFGDGTGASTLRLLTGRLTASVESRQWQIETAGGTVLLTQASFPAYSPDIGSGGYEVLSRSPALFDALTAEATAGRDLVFRIAAAFAAHELEPRFAGSGSGAFSATLTHQEAAEAIELAPRFAGSGSGAFSATLTHGEVAEAIELAPRFAGSGSGVLTIAELVHFMGENYELAPAFAGSASGVLSASLVRKQPARHELTPRFAGTATGAFSATLTHQEAAEAIRLAPRFAGTATGAFNATLTHGEVAEAIELTPRFAGTATGAFSAALRHQEAAEAIRLALRFTGTARGTLAALLEKGGFSDDFAEDERASQPRDRILTCVELSHPAISAPVRLVNDIEDRVVAGETYRATRFEAKLADDAKRRAPRAEIAVGNVGRRLSAWVEQSAGGAGGTARLFQVLAVDAALPDWELELDIIGIGGNSANVKISLGFDPLLGRPAVALRYDPQTAPGLF